MLISRRNSDEELALHVCSQVHVCLYVYHSLTLKGFRTKINPTNLTTRHAILNDETTRVGRTKLGSDCIFLRQQNIVLQ